MIKFHFATSKTTVSFVISPSVVNYISVLLLKGKQLTLFILKILEKKTGQVIFVVNLFSGIFIHHLFIEYLLLSNQALF